MIHGSALKDAKKPVAPAVLSAWIEVPEFDWNVLARGGARTVQFDKGRTLFTQGDSVDHVYVLSQGRVRLVLLSAAGHEKHMAIVGTQGMVGECSAFLDGRHSVTAIASTPVVAWQIERKRLLESMESDPACLRQVLWLISTKLRIVANQNLLLSQATATQRVICNLVQLAETYGDAVPDGLSIRIAFTHQELANIAGLSRVMTTNVLAQLHDEGLVEKTGARCLIRDLKTLRQRSMGAV